MGVGHAAVRSLRSADPEMPRLLQNRMKMSPLLSTVPVTATSKPSRYRSIHAQRSPAQRPESVYAPSTPSTARAGRVAADGPDGARRTGKTVFVFVSHQWLGHQDADPDNKQYEATCGAIQALAARNDVGVEAVRVWMDVLSCVEIKPRAPHAIDATSSP